MQQMSGLVSDLKNAIIAPTVDQDHVKYLIGLIIDPRSKCSLDEVADSKAVIHTAIEQGHLEVVRDLSNAGASVNDIGTKSPLLTAVEAGQLEIVKVLLEAQANPDGAENDPQSPLYSAVDAGLPKIVTELLGAGANPNGAGNDPRSPLYRAAERGDLGILESLLAAGAEVNDRKLSLFSSQNGTPRQTTKYALVLSSGTDDNQNSTKSWKLKVRNAIFEIDIAQIEGCQRLVELLDTVNFQNIEERNQNLLFKLKVEKLLCKWLRVSFPNLSHENYENNARPLHIACQLGLADVVRMLIKHGADPITPDEQGNNTPLSVAIANAQPSPHDKITTIILPLLLQQGAGFCVPNLAVNLKDKNLFGHIPNLGPVMVIGTGLTRNVPDFQDAITNEAEFEEFLEHEKMKENDLLKFAKKYRALCEDRLPQFQGNDSAMRDFHKMLDRHVRERLRKIYSNQMKSAAQLCNGDSESGVLKENVQTLIDVVWNPHNDSSKRTELDETFHQLMQQLMALQTYLQDDKGLENKATWDYSLAKAKHYAPAGWPALLIILSVIALAVSVIGALLGGFKFESVALGEMTFMGTFIGLPGTGFATWFFSHRLRPLYSSDNITYDNSKNQLPVSLQDVIEQAGLQTIPDLLGIFSPELISKAEIAALQNATTLSKLDNALTALLAKQGLISKPGFTYSENVRNKFTLFSQKSKSTDTVLELGAEPDSSAGESKDEGAPLLSAGPPISNYRTVGTEESHQSQPLIVPNSSSSESEELSGCSDNDEAPQLRSLAIN